MSRPRWMTRNLVVLSGVSLAQDAASEMLYPLMPLLLTRVLGAPDAVVGITEGIAEGASSVMKYLAGRISDRIGRKPMVGAGYTLAGIGKLLIALATVWPMVIAGRIVDRVGKGIRGAPRDALIAVDVPGRDIGRAFGFHRAADTAGAVVGPLAALLVLALTHGSLRTALWVALVPAVIAVVLVAGVRERHDDGRKRPTATGGPPPHSARYRRVVAVLTAVSLVNFPDALILLRVGQVGFSATGVVAVYVLYNAVYALLSFPGGALSDRISPARVYALGLLCFAAGYIGLGLTRDPGLVVAIMAVYGGFNGLTDGVGKAWVSGLAEPAARGRAQGTFQALTGAAVLVAGIWAGLLWDTGPGQGVVPLLISGSVGVAAAMLLPAMVGRREPRED